MTLACDLAKSKLIEVVTVADVDNEDRVVVVVADLKLMFGHKTKLLSRL